MKENRKQNSGNTYDQSSKKIVRSVKRQKLAPEKARNKNDAIIYHDNRNRSHKKDRKMKFNNKQNGAHHQQGVNRKQG